MKITAACAAALALLATAGVASAQDVSFNVGVTTDYVFRGISQNNEEPALQGGVDATFGSFYVGGWASNVDFGDSTKAEVDIYGGYKTEVSGFAVDLGVVGYLYTSDPSTSDYDYLEVKAAVSRAVGPVTVGAAVYYSPDFFGAADDEATYVELNGAFAPFSRWTISGAVGEQFTDVSDDYVTWNVGATYALSDTVAFDVRYHDNDIDSPALPIADGRVNATIKALF